MRYAEARPLLSTGDLLFWRNGKGLSRLIRMVTGASSSHVAVVLRFAGRVWVAEAWEGDGRVRLWPLSVRLEDAPSLAWMRTGASVPAPAALVAFTLDTIGRPYSYVDAIRAGLRLPATGRGYICSEFACAALAAGGLVLDGPQLTPGDVEEAAFALVGSATRITA